MLGAARRQSNEHQTPHLGIFDNRLAYYDCDRVTPNLFVGSCPLDSKEIDELKSLGITAILSLQTDEDLRERGIHLL
jgi:hypothetical protein